MIENNGILTLKEVENIKIDPERDFYSATPEEIKKGYTTAVSYTHLDVYKRQF